jgi:hypothetical protein
MGVRSDDTREIRSACNPLPIRSRFVSNAARATVSGTTALALFSFGCLTLVGGFDPIGNDAGVGMDAAKHDALAHDAPLDVTYELGNTPCPGLACDGGLCIVKSDLHHCGTCENDCSLLANIDPNGVACELGSCLYKCDPGFADCTSQGTGCTNQATDPDNCGQCGHSCSGGPCIDSMCGPATFFDGSAVGARIADIATDGMAVVWGNLTDNTIDFVETSGGPSIVLAGAASGAPYPPVNVAISGKLINYTLYDGVNAYQGSAMAGKAGSGVIDNTLPTSFTSGLAFDKAATSVFFLQYATGQINVLSCLPSALGCSIVTSVASSAMGSSIAVDGTPHHAVFGDIGNGAVVVYSFSHDTDTPIPTQPTASWVTTDGTNAYWGSTIPGTPTLYPILEAPLASPTSVKQLLATSAGPCTGIATDGTTRVYFATDGGIYSVPIGGGPSPTLVTPVATAHHLKYSNKTLFFDDTSNIYAVTTQ